MSAKDLLDTLEDDRADVDSRAFERGYDDPADKEGSFSDLTDWTEDAQ